jgi:predicted RNA-binding protein with PIN domain
VRILIDGYNLIRRVPELNEADRVDLREGRDALFEQLASYRIGKGHHIAVVFDGAEAVHLGGSREKIRGITVRYSPRGSSADSIILEAMGNNEADMLVSADRELTDAAECSGVTSISPELFWDKVQEDMYRKLKGEEPEDSECVLPHRGTGGKKMKGGRKLSKRRRRDRGRRDKL